MFKVDPQGNGTPFFDATELEVHAMTPAPNGGLYVATSPDGRIYKVDRNGAATTFFDPDDKYIWALATDARGNLYAGTGEKGVVYKIAPDGKGAPFYQTKATHATALAIDRNRATAGRHRVARPRPADRRRRQGLHAAGHAVPGDSHAAVRRQGRLVRRGRQRPSGQQRRALADRRTRAVWDSCRGTRAGRVGHRLDRNHVGRRRGNGRRRRRAPSATTSRGAPKGAVYRIAPDGLWDQLWESREDAPYDLAFDAENRLIVGTGNKGKIYRLEGNPLQPMLLARASAQQVTALYKDARGRLYYATANPGQTVPAVVDPRDARHLSIGSARRADGVHVGHGQLARHRAERRPRGDFDADRATAKRPTTPGARGRPPTPRRKARPSSVRKRATCSGARR